MSLGRGTPPAQIASPEGLNPVKARTLLHKRVPSLNPEAAQCIVRVFCNTVQGTDSKTRFSCLVAAFARNEKLVQDAVLAYQQTLRGHEGDMRKVVCQRADDLATPERKRQLSANKQLAIQGSKFSACFRPVMNEREELEMQMRSVQKNRIGSVSNL